MDNENNGEWSKLADDKTWGDFLEKSEYRAQDAGFDIRIETFQNGKLLISRDYFLPYPGKARDPESLTLVHRMPR